MSYTSVAEPTLGTTNETSVRRSAAIAVALSIVSLIALLARDTNDGPVWRVSLIVGAAIAIVTWVVFGLVARRTLAKSSAKSSTRAALVLGILAVLSIVAFWMAVPPILGTAAVALAIDARDRRPFRGEWVATLGGVLGGLGVVAGLVLSFVG
jgi:F0F1-type ATP synthase assembly protein I